MPGPVTANFRSPTAEHMWNMALGSRAIIIIDPLLRMGLAALMSAVSTLVWAIRRKV
jgi:hypothetical protein